MAGQRSVGVVGTGSMGTALARRLLETGFGVVVTNRTPARAEALLRDGASWAPTPGELAARVSVAVTLVADDEAVEEVVAGPRGVLTGARPGLALVNMSTVSPDASARVARRCAEAGVPFLRAPVSGGPSLAESGQLGVLLSGPPELQADLADLLEAVSSGVFYLGPAEEARVMKLALNMLIGTTVAGLGEALVLGERLGLDWERMLEVFVASAVASPFVRYKAPLLARRDFPPAFSNALLAKDLGLATGLARAAGSSAVVTERTRQVVEQAIAAGLGGADATSVVLLLEQQAGIRKDVSMEVDG